MAKPIASQTIYATPPSPTNSSPSLTQSTTISTSTPSTSPPAPSTPPRSSRSRTRYPDLGRVPLHRRGTSKTYERLEDLLKEAGYKETRVFTPEGERTEASSVKPEPDQQGGVRNSVGAFVGFLAGLMPAASRSTSSLGTTAEAYSPPISPLAQRQMQNPRATNSSCDLSSSQESLEPTPRPTRFRPSVYSQTHFSQQDLLRPTHLMVHRASDQYSYTSSRQPPLPSRSPLEPCPNSPLPTAGPSYQHIAQPRPSRAGAYLRHMASAPNMPKRPTSTPAHQQQQRRRTLLNDDYDIENGKPPLPRSWIESVARAVLFGGVGAYIGGPPAVEILPSQAPTHKTLRPTRSSLSQTSPAQRTKRLPPRSGLSDQTNTAPPASSSRATTHKTAGGELLLAPPELFTRIRSGRAVTSTGAVSRTRVVCRSAPVSRTSSQARGGSASSREKREREQIQSRDMKGYGRGRTAERRLPSLANTQTEGDKWAKSKRVKGKDKDVVRNRYLSGWGMEGESSDEGGRASSSEEEGELDLARMLLNPKRQNSIVSLRRHLNDENAMGGKSRKSAGLRVGRGMTAGAAQGSRSGSVQQKIAEDWDGSETEDWGQGWVRKGARKLNSEDEDDDESFAGFLGEGRNGGRAFGSGRSNAGGNRLGIPGTWALISKGS